MKNSTIDIWWNDEALQEPVSNCCFSEIIMQDENGHGKCSDCKENCTPATNEEETKELEVHPLFLCLFFFFLPYQYGATEKPTTKQVGYNN